MESRGKCLFANKEGQCQGDLLAGAAFTVTIQKDLKLLSKEVQHFRGLVRTGADDVILTRPKDKIMEPAKKFVE